MSESGVTFITLSIVGLLILTEIFIFAGWLGAIAAVIGAFLGLAIVHLVDIMVKYLMRR